MKWLRNILKGASLTTALFIFEACYGTPKPPLYEEEGEAPMTFKVISKETGTPLEGIHVKSNPCGYYFEDVGVTGADGTCKVSLHYSRNLEGPYVRFEDSEGLFAAKDTMLADLREREIVIKLNPAQ